MNIAIDWSEEPRCAEDETAGRHEAARIGRRLAAGKILSAEDSDFLARFLIKGGQDQLSWDTELIAAEELCDEKNAEAYKDAPAIIEGMLAQGDLALITAGSKSFKSWLALQIALCTANGIPFWGRKTTQTKTLVLNFELKPASMKKRIKAIASSLKCGKKHLHLLNLRNKPITPAFLPRLTEIIKEFGFKLIILDPLYSMYGVVDDPNVENSNPAMTALLSTIRAACEAAGAAVVIVHHHSKGDSSAKASIDRASGAGALGRFPDSVMSLVRHESPDAYVVGIDFRDFPPCEPFVIRREHYIMVLDPDLDPTAKKVAKPPTNQKVSTEDVLMFLPVDGSAIERHSLEKTIAIRKDCTRETAKRWVERAISNKVCFANRYGIFRPTKEDRTHF